MTAYDASEWTDLFVATAGATAALAGLLFVAISINIERILRLEGIPDRALQALIQLLGLLVFSLLALAPGQAAATLGIEVLVVALPMTAVSLGLVGRALRASGSSGWLDVRQWVVAAGTVPFVAAGISLLAESGGGLYWVLGGIVLALMGAVLNAWVLLVEILR